MGDIQLIIILLAISLYALWWLYFVEYRTYREDEARQRLFSIRDDLFEKARTGEVDFQSDAYCITRNTINGLIHYIHEISFLRMVQMIVASKELERKFPTEYGNKMKEALDKITKEQKAIILKTHMEMHMTVVAYIVKNSIVLFALMEPLVYLLMTIEKWDDIRQRISLGKSRIAWNRIDAEALRVGWVHARQEKINTVNV